MSETDTDTMPSDVPTNDTPALTPEQVASIADDQMAQINDPVGYARAQAIAQITAEYDTLVAVADDATKAKLATIRDTRLAALDPPAPPEPVALLTVSDLGIPAVDASSEAAVTLSQYVEPERDGSPWCTWQDAENMLVAAAKPLLRGQAGSSFTGYVLTRDDTASVLTLVLVSA